MTLRNAVVGWVLILGMVAYATVLTVLHAGRSSVDAAASLSQRATPQE